MCSDGGRGAARRLRLAILQRVITGYRAGVFRQLAAHAGIQLRVFIGDDLPDSKVRGTADLQGLDVTRLPTRFIRVGSRIFCHHRQLRRELERYQPDVVLCEGESNVLSYLQAKKYRRLHPRVKLIHWSLGGLPGVPAAPRSIRSRLKFHLQRGFDAYLVYSSFGRQQLLELGHPSDRVFVATNVADTDRQLEQARQLELTPAQARAKHAIPERFTALYSGAMDPGKRPDWMLDFARMAGGDRYNFVLIGAGGELERLRERARREHLDNVLLPGHVGSDLGHYYRAADVMVLPGRGGMVISEAMCWGLPVIVYQADGTEYDLIRHGETGLLMSRGDRDEFFQALEQLRTDAEKCRQLGLAGKRLIESAHTTQHFVQAILNAVFFAHPPSSRHPPSVDTVPDPRRSTDPAPAPESE